MHSRSIPLILVTGLCVPAVTACGSDDESVGLFGDGEGGQDDGSSGDGADDGDGDGGGGSGDDGSGDDGDDGAGDDGDDTKYDVDPGDGGGPACAEGEDCGCIAVDLLFVIDTSGSMLPFQQGLAAAFPQFVDAMFDVLPPGTDIHVGATTTAFCDGSVNGPNGGHNENVLGDCSSPDRPTYTEMAYIAPTDRSIPGNGKQGRLIEHQGQRYFAANTGDATTRDPLKQWFGGVATAGAGCSFEYSASGAAYAVHPINDATNAGFLRDEGALLMVFVLSDEYDESPEGLDFYRDTIVDAKAGCGGEVCVMTAGLLNEVCSPDHDPFVWQFLNAFGEAPVWGPIGTSLGWPLSPDTSGYPDVVGDALAQVVKQRCDAIPPVG